MKNYFLVAFACFIWSYQSVTGGVNCTQADQGHFISGVAVSLNAKGNAVFH